MMYIKSFNAKTKTLVLENKPVNFMSKRVGAYLEIVLSNISFMNTALPTNTPQLLYLGWY